MGGGEDLGEGLPEPLASFSASELCDLRDHLGFKMKAAFLTPTATGSPGQPLGRPQVRAPQQREKPRSPEPGLRWLLRGCKYGAPLQHRDRGWRGLRGSGSERSRREGLVSGRGWRALPGWGGAQG